MLQSDETYLLTIPKYTKNLLNTKQGIYRRDTEKIFCISVNCGHNVTSSSSHKRLCSKKGYLSLKDASLETKSL